MVDINGYKVDIIFFTNPFKDFIIGLMVFGFL